MSRVYLEAFGQGRCLFENVAPDRGAGLGSGSMQLIATGVRELFDLARSAEEVMERLTENVNRVLASGEYVD